MFPTIVTIGKVTLHTYGLLVALGGMAAFFLARAEASRKNIDPEKISDLVFYLLIAGILGARLFYAFTNLEAYIHDPLEFFKIWNGGLVFYGSFIVALPTLLIYVKKHGLPLGKVLDIVAPALALGHFFGRMGCFFAGCCYGSASDLPFAVVFTHPDSLAPLYTPLHPTQIYSALSNLTIFFVIWFLRKRTRIDGQLFWIYVLIYAAARSFIEMFRGDFRGDFIFEIFSPAQAIAGIMAVSAVVCLTILKRRHAARMTKKNA